MSNDYFNPSGTPAQGSGVDSSPVRAELLAIGAGFNKLPSLTGNAYKVVYVNASGSALDAIGGNGLLKLSSSGVPTIAVAGTDYIADIAATTHAASSKATPVDADEVGLVDSADSNVLKKLTWANIKATLKTYFDPIYAAIAGSVSQAFSASQIELGNASDTTLTRVSAGVIAVEGNTVAMLASSQNYTAPQRSAILTDNDGSFDLSAKQNFKCTPSAGFTLTFTNQADGLAGSVLLVNGSNYAVAAHANTKISSTALSRISVTGTYRIDYMSDGTNCYCTASESLA